MKIKVCGMKYPDNITELCALPIDMAGFIFYPSSPRYAGGLNPDALRAIPPSIRKVGVFVDEQPEEILKKAKAYQLQLIQLHGNESPEVCSRLKNEGCTLIKAFRTEVATDLDDTACYESVCDYFLFDTKTPVYGGSGRQFDWSILAGYRGKVPFFLSGGIGPGDARRLSALHHPMLYAVDLNSRFEISPGMKDIELLKQFIYNR